MSMPFYVSPEQLMKDRADFARKGIARGRSVVAVQYADGVLFVSENPSQALHKVSEIYDRIAFAAVGRYNEFENQRIAGVRLADMRGYAYVSEWSSSVILYCLIPVGSFCGVSVTRTSPSFVPSVVP